MGPVEPYKSFAPHVPVDTKMSKIWIVVPHAVGFNCTDHFVRGIVMTHAGKLDCQWKWQTITVQEGSKGSDTGALWGKIEEEGKHDAWPLSHGSHNEFNERDEKHNGIWKEEDKLWMLGKKHGVWLFAHIVYFAHDKRGKMSSLNPNRRGMFPSSGLRWSMKQPAHRMCTTGPNHMS